MIANKAQIVCPVVAAKVGVMNSLFYSEKELKSFNVGWNGSPITVGHPSLNGEDVTANNPIIDNTSVIGKFYNVEFSDDKLKGEIWIDREKAETLGFQNIIESIQNKDMMEVSTGLYCNVETSFGEYEGEKYNGIVSNIMPDHLAVLPNEVGACSIEDGCGTMRSNCDNTENVCKCSGKCKKKNTDVEEVTKSNKLINNEEATMSETLQEDTVAKNEEAQEEVTEEVKQEEVKQEEVKQENKELSFEEKLDGIVKNADSGMQELIKESVQAYNKAKTEMVDKIVEKSSFEKSELEGLSINVIKKVNELLPKEANVKEEVVANYEGNGNVPVYSNSKTPFNFKYDLPTIKEGE
jgi:hypothetical protein